MKRLLPLLFILPLEAAAGLPSVKAEGISYSCTTCLCAGIDEACECGCGSLPYFDDLIPRFPPQYQLLPAPGYIEFRGPGTLIGACVKFTEDKFVIVPCEEELHL